MTQAYEVSLMYKPLCICTKGNARAHPRKWLQCEHVCMHRRRYTTFPTLTTKERGGVFEKNLKMYKHVWERQPRTLPFWSPSTPPLSHKNWVSRTIKNRTEFFFYFLKSRPIPNGKFWNPPRFQEMRKRTFEISFFFFFFSVIKTLLRLDSAPRPSVDLHSLDLHWGFSLSVFLVYMPFSLCSNVDCVACRGLETRAWGLAFLLFFSNRVLGGFF